MQKSLKELFISSIHRDRTNKQREALRQNKDLTMLFLDTILSSFLAIRNRSSSRVIMCALICFKWNVMCL